MIQRTMDRLRQWPLREPNLERSDIKDALERQKVETWFLYAYDEWRSRWHVWRSILWAKHHLDRDAAILETGCGCGWNLFWLAANGFRVLTGLDLDSGAIAAGNDLARGAGYPVNLLCRNALAPDLATEDRFDGVFALNWTYHVQEFKLDEFLEYYSRFLSKEGVFIMDFVDKTFNEHPESRYLTSDWQRPVEVRRPSEYVHRFTVQEVIDTALSTGFRVTARYARRNPIPRFLVVLTRI